MRWSNRRKYLREACPWRITELGREGLNLTDVTPGVSDFPPIDPVAFVVAKVAMRQAVDRGTRRGGARLLP